VSDRTQVALRQMAREAPELAARLDGDWHRALREWSGDADFYTTRERSVSERLPWEHFDVGVKTAGLVREWERALVAEPALAGTA
jgi:hypothetical protein